MTREAAAACAAPAEPGHEQRQSQLLLRVKLLFLFTLLWSAPAFAKTPGRYVLLGELGAGAGTSSWRGDYLGCGSVLLGFRLFDWVAIHGQLREGYASIDERLLTTLAFGVGLTPRLGEHGRLVLRVSGVHQHEESVAVARENPLLVPFGVGSGIRHRMGGELAIGGRYEILEIGGLDLTVGGEVFGFLSPDDRGPRNYVGVLAVLGAELAL